MHRFKDTVRNARLIGLSAALLVGAACQDPTGHAKNPYPHASTAVGAVIRAVTIDFSSFGGASGDVFNPDFYRRDGIVFPDEMCGSAGCSPWFVSFIQGSASLAGDPRFGPVTATFTRPISALSVEVAPALQGSATYILNLYAASGTLVGTTSVTVTQDERENTNSGYFTISVTDLSKHAKRFTLDNVFVRSSFATTTYIPYGVRSITYTY
jgi:hypothetical protein